MRTEYTNPMIQKAFDLLERLSADELTRQRADVREKALKNEMSLLEDARMEGREEGVELGEMIEEIRTLQRVLHVPVGVGHRFGNKHDNGLKNGTDNVPSHPLHSKIRCRIRRNDDRSPRSRAKRPCSPVLARSCRRCGKILTRC